ncbi:MAG: signal peptidase I, partial [Acidimicrobiales bacterium]
APTEQTRPSDPTRPSAQPRVRSAQQRPNVVPPGQPTQRRPLTDEERRQAQEMAERRRQGDDGSSRSATQSVPNRNADLFGAPKVEQRASVFDQDDVAQRAEPDPSLFGDKPDSDRSRAIVEWIAVIAGAIVVAFLVKTFLVAAYDFHGVNRGDLVVFSKPEVLNSTTPDLIKRVIALEGETVELVDGSVYVDGRKLIESYVQGKDTVWLGFRNDEIVAVCGGIDLCTVPEDHVFVMGDNRDNSTDSRVFGPISETEIVGRAFVKIWPLSGIGWL